jgi:hypothetical protein
MKFTRPQRIALVTDFGSGIYSGQIHLRLNASQPTVPVIDYMSDLPAFRPDLAAYLLPAITRAMPAATLYLCVVDPGVGGQRSLIALQCGDNWFIAPDNGLLALLIRFADQSPLLLKRIDWRPSGSIAPTFHGRDIFTPIAIEIMQGRLPEPNDPLTADQLIGADWPDECAQIIYSDRYGNLMTGLRASRYNSSESLVCQGRQLPYAQTFCHVAVGQPFWYPNAFGLVEIAVNQGRAETVLNAQLGTHVTWQSS